MKAVIIAGGKGTRLGKIGERVPKPLVKISGKPILEHQINLLAKFGIKEVWLLTGYKGEMIRDYFGSGDRWQIKIHYSKENKPLGTAGALKSISQNLTDDFLLFYGDVMVNLSLDRLVRFHRKRSKNALATIVIHPNNHPFDSDLVEVKNDGIVKIYPKPHQPEVWRHNLVCAGVYIFSPKIFPFIKANRKADLGKEIFPGLLKKGQLITGYRSFEYFRDTGTPDRLKQVRKDYREKVYQNLNFQKKQQAIFLDRDGVINKEVNELVNIDELKIYPASSKAIKKVNDSTFHTIVITNQPMLAKGKLTEDGLDQIHRKLESLLGARGTKIDAIYYCPHHPEGGWKGENKNLKIKCSCRKPKVGLIKKATRDFNIDLAKSFFIGDSLTDYKTAKNAKIKFIGVETGYGREQLLPLNKSKPNSILLKKNLAQAVSYILANVKK